MKAIEKFIDKIKNGIIAWCLLLIVSCETVEPPYYTGPEFINFERRDINIREDGGMAKIRVNIGGKLNTAPVSVTYSVTANDNAVALYTIKDEGSLTIPSGAGFADIEITPIDNAIPDGEKIVELTITSISGGNYTIGFPGPEGLNSTIRIRIIDDDCPLDRAFISGGLIGQDVSETSEEIVGDGEVGDGPFFRNVTIRDHPTNSKVIIIEGFFPVYTGFEGRRLEIYLDACPEEAEIFDYDIVYTDQQARQYQIIPAGTGTFNQEIGLLTLELELTAQGAGSFGEWKFTYKK